MEMTVRYAKNADADVDASYLRNLPLIKLLQQEPVNTEDWDVLLSATPNGEDKLLWCLSYVGALCALDATDFDNWFIWRLAKLRARPKSAKIFWPLVWQHGRSIFPQILSLSS